MTYQPRIPAAPHDPADGPGISAEQILHVLDAELSPRARLATVALLLGALLVTATVTALLLTEPALPLRTQLGFGLIVLAGLAWSGYFVSALLRRHTAYVTHRIATASLAAGVTAAFLLAALALAWFTPALAGTALAAAALLLPLLVGALVLLWRARRERARLHARKRALAQHDLPEQTQ
jgi:FlaA1/EpsC-like NDP-sugar epimerase